MIAYNDETDTPAFVVMENCVASVDVYADVFKGLQHILAIISVPSAAIVFVFPKWATAAAAASDADIGVAHSNI
ncbi:hypothetical protein [Herbaspirillum sp. RV1423]|uniref:hypothetical protein n=1 Tax=Herbaspirillum sp. RV1423 TaxID=1443993 RepID=UPI0004AEC8BC|nr:hypothetical protein [Herbaspirillum sp. RV1423]